MRQSGIALPDLPDDASEFDQQLYAALYKQFTAGIIRLAALEGTLGNIPGRYGWVKRGITTQTAATYTVLNSDFHMIANRAGTITYTLPTASQFTGRELVIRTITANTVVSNASDVVPLVGGAAGTAILAATAGKWALLCSDGTNWQIMEGN